MPFLVLYERKFYCFDGELSGNEIKYKSFCFPSPDNEKDDFGRYLVQGDALRLEGRDVIFLKGNKVFKKISIKLTEFAPEHPFLIKFE